MDEVVKRVLKQESVNKVDAFISPEECNVLLKEENNQELIIDVDTLKQYPEYPLYKRIAVVFQQCLQFGECPVLDLAEYYMLDETDYSKHRKEMIADMVAKLQAAESLWDHWSSSEQDFHIRKILKDLGKRGLMDILGMRKTIGSVDVFPPSKTTLINNFNKKNKPSSKLTVGARALAKHCHRDQTSSWWGSSLTGGEDAKNTYANEVLHRILNDAAWINIHCLPGELAVLEVRTSEGYGARWTSDGDSFRGFLEPQMENGHQIGWKH